MESDCEEMRSNPRGLARRTRRRNVCCGPASQGGCLSPPDAKKNSRGRSRDDISSRKPSIRKFERIDLLQLVTCELLRANCIADSCNSLAGFLMRCHHLPKLREENRVGHIVILGKPADADN